MSFGWVRRVSVDGDWAALPMTLTLRAGALAGFGYLLVATVVALFVCAPTALALASVIDSQGVAADSLTAIATLSFVAATALAATLWALAYAARSFFARTVVEIAPRMIAVHQHSLLGTKTSRTPVTAFEGICVLPQTSLDGRLFGVYLIHPERHKSPLLMRAPAIDRDWVSAAAASLNQPIIGTPATGAAKPSETDAHESLAAA
ncbi:MAG: hypothetical protein AAFQ45_04135 [Pseudomonadota bacterium]